LPTCFAEPAGDSLDCEFAVVRLLGKLACIGFYFNYDQDFIVIRTDPDAIRTPIIIDMGIGTISGLLRCL
jgi:hypothetical protein